MTERRKTPRARCLERLVLFAGLGVAVSAPPASAWPQEIYENMAHDALRLVPPSLRRVLWIHEKQIVRGTQSLEGELASTLMRDARAGDIARSETAAAVDRRITLLASMVDGHRPFAEVAFELGKLLRVAADLSDPTVVGAGSRNLDLATREYYRFVTLHSHEIPLVYDWNVPSLVDGAEVSIFFESLIETARRSAGLLSRAFWRDGELLPASAFDYRSVPYAVASLGYSRSVTAASQLWLVAWVRANGDFKGYRYFRDRQGLTGTPTSKPRAGLFFPARGSAAAGRARRRADWWLEGEAPVRFPYWVVVWGGTNS